MLKAIYAVPRISSGRKAKTGCDADRRMSAPSHVLRTLPAIYQRNSKLESLRIRILSAGAVRVARSPHIPLTRCSPACACLVNFLTGFIFRTALGTQQRSKRGEKRL